MLLLEMGEFELANRNTLKHLCFQGGRLLNKRSALSIHAEQRSLVRQDLQISGKAAVAFSSASRPTEM